MISLLQPSFTKHIKGVSREKTLENRFKDKKKLVVMAQAAAAVNNKKNKKGAIQLVFSELDDLFLNTKGKAMRNLRKKVDKYVDLEKQVRTGKHQANAQQKEQIASIPELKEEIVELEALCKLYMESNPGFDKKAAPSLSEEDVRRALMNALSTFGQACGLK